MPAQFFERNKVTLVSWSDIKDTGQTSSYVHMGEFRRIAAAIQTGEVAATKKVTLSIMQATASGGTGAKELKKVESAAAGAEGDVFALQIEAVAAELDTANGYEYVAIKAVTDDANAVAAVAAIILSEPRFAPVS